MNLGMPRFLLFAEIGSGKGVRHLLPERPDGCCAQKVPDTFSAAGAWRFVLRTLDGGVHFEAADVESDVFGDRLELLTVVRALEALDQPSRVTLVGCTNHLRQAIQFGMPQWRTDDWLWERFGQMTPVKNADLWQRLDRLMAFHEVDCRQRRIDGAHPVTVRPNYLAPRETSAGPMAAAVMAFAANAWIRLPVGFRRRMVACGGKLRQLAFASRKAMRSLREQFDNILVPTLRRGNALMGRSGVPRAGHVSDVG